MLEAGVGAKPDRRRSVGDVKPGSAGDAQIRGAGGNLGAAGPKRRATTPWNGALPQVRRSRRWKRHAVFAAWSACWPPACRRSGSAASPTRAAAAAAAGSYPRSSPLRWSLCSPARAAPRTPSSSPRSSRPRCAVASASRAACPTPRCATRCAHSTPTRCAASCIARSTTPTGARRSRPTGCRSASWRWTASR